MKNEIGIQIKTLAERYDLLKRSFNMLEENFESYKQEEPEEFKKNFPDFKKENIDFRLDSIGYKIGLWSEDEQEYIVIGFTMYYKKYYKKDLILSQKGHIESVGHYDAVFDLDGTVLDDYFVVY